MSRFSVTYQNLHYPDVDEVYVEVPDAPHVPCPGDVVTIADKKAWIVHDVLWFVYPLDHSTGRDSQQHVMVIVKKPRRKKSKRG